MKWLPSGYFKSREELLREREQSQIVFDAVPAMIWVKDTENRILRCNQAAVQNKGLTVEEIEGKSAYEIDPPEDAAKYHADDLEVVNSGKPKLGIVEVLTTASGETRWMQTDKYPLRDAEGEITGVLVMAMDITERKRAQEELEQRIAEVLEANRVKDEFLSVMSHELRTPLNAILGYLGLLELVGELADENLDMVQRSQANARRLLDLINDVLDISRMESGRAEIVPGELHIESLVNHIRSQMDVLAAEKQLDFNITIDGSLPSVIHADEDAFTKIMVNLLSNAFKFTEKGSVDLSLASENGHMIISVSDTGIGIPVYMHETIFERFRQVDSSSSRQHGGSGLGLSIVQKLCQLMGGTVTVESDVDQGSTFTVKLPLESVTEAEGAVG